MLDYGYCSLNIVFCPYLQEWWSILWQGMKLRESHRDGGRTFSQWDYLGITHGKWFGWFRRWTPPPHSYLAIAI